MNALVTAYLTLTCTIVALTAVVIGVWAIVTAVAENRADRDALTDRVTWTSWATDLDPRTTWELDVITPREPTRKADEYDLVTGWRRVLCYMRRAGVTEGIKRRMRRRERHTARHRLRRNPDEQ